MFYNLVLLLKKIDSFSLIELLILNGFIVCYFFVFFFIVECVEGVVRELNVSVKWRI